MINRSNYELWFIDFLEGQLSPENEMLLFRFLKEYPDLKDELEEMKQAFLSPANINIRDKENLYKPFLSWSLDEQIIAMLEGDLSEEERLVIEDKLKTDAHAKALYTAFEQTQLSSYSMDTSGIDKASLYQSNPSILEVDDMILSEMDGTISPEDRKWLSEHFTKEEIQQKVEVFKSTFLTPDLTISYPNKNNLRKKRRIFALWNAQDLSLRIAAAILLLIGMGWSLRMAINYHPSQDNPTMAIRHQNLPLPSQEQNSIPSTLSQTEELTSRSVVRSSAPHVSPTINIDDKPHSSLQKTTNTKHTYPVYHTGRSPHSRSDIVTVKTKESMESMTAYPNDRPNILKSVAVLPSRMITPNSIGSDAEFSIEIPEIEMLQEQGYLVGEEERDPPFELEVPKVYSTVIKSLVNSGVTYLKGKEENKAIVSFNLGSFSFYRTRDL